LRDRDAAMLVEPDRLLQNLVLRRLPTLVDRAEDCRGFLPSHIVSSPES
jgi:hypothetical protein